MEQTNPDFELFKTECLKWIEFFGLKGWRVLFEYKKINGFAQCQVEGIANRVVIFALNSEIDEQDKPHIDIAQSAFHEVCEILLWPLEYIGTCRYVQPEEFAVERHNLIRILENTVYKELKK